MSKNDTKEYNEGHAVEILDRVDFMGAFINDRLMNHPAILKAGQQKRVEQLLMDTYDLYQSVGG